MSSVAFMHPGRLWKFTSRLAMSTQITYKIRYAKLYTMLVCNDGTSANEDRKIIPAKKEDTP
jgi:hypothetical protein